MRRLALLGSTGSIGTQTLDVIAASQGKFGIAALAAYRNDQLLERQINEFKPDVAVLVDKTAADRLVKRYRGNTVLLAGEEGLMEAAVHQSADVVLTSMVGFAGLKPTLAAIDAGKNIALANKETLVAAGALVTARAKAKHVQILPVDSEHSAVLQCLQGENKCDVKRIILTASGGPLRGLSQSALEHVTVEQCLHHPNWAMGKKVTIDSATLANKGLEVMEARWLFDIEYDQIDVVIHPQSVIHSMVEYNDGAVMAQLGVPDMRIPIQYALTYPGRFSGPAARLDFTRLSALTFEQPDIQTFSALYLAYTAGRAGGTMPCVFNAANEIAVHAFLSGKIKFVHIADIIRHTMDAHRLVSMPDFDALCAADAWARSKAADIVQLINQ
jgi:1-deoxy-D-xylulose-5-phosphate reductoisomerase